jgi:hypothetical protein
LKCRTLPFRPPAELCPAAGHKTRRTALRLFAGAPALAILPAVATASPVHPDAALLAMEPAIDATDREFEVALDALKAAEEVYFDKEPDGLEQPGADFLAEERQALDLLRSAARMREGKAPSPAWAAYYQAVADRDLEIERLKAECGVTAAHEMEAATSEAVNSVKADLLDTPAKTLAGLIFKARYAVREGGNDYDEDVMESIVDDLLAMADDPEDFANV